MTNSADPNISCKEGSTVSITLVNLNLAKVYILYIVLVCKILFVLIENVDTANICYYLKSYHPQSLTRH